MPQQQPEHKIWIHQGYQSNHSKNTVCRTSWTHILGPVISQVKIFGRILLNKLSIPITVRNGEKKIKTDSDFTDFKFLQSAIHSAPLWTHPLSSTEIKVVSYIANL
jgi:hypothetical protein